MGFMAGFGPAFSEGIKKNTELREQRKDDTFKMTFAEMSKRNEQYSKDKKEDQGFVRKAKAIASTKNPEAWPLVYQWVKAGLSDDQIEKNMAGSFEVGKASPGAVATPGSEAANPVASQGSQAQGAAQLAQGSSETPLDAQTQQALPTKPQAAPDDTMVQEAPEDASSNTKFLSGMSGKFKGMTGNKFMRDTFGNGGGAQSRADMVAESRDAIGQMPGMEGANAAWDGFQADEPDASGISWTPAKDAPAPDKIDNLNKAMIELSEAKVSKDPERLAQAQRRVSALRAATIFEEETKADAVNGTLGSEPVSVYDAKGNYVGFDRITRNENGEAVGSDGVTKYPAGTHMEPVSAAEREQEQKIIEKLAEPTRKYNEKVDNFTGLMRDIGTLDKIYAGNPNALQGGASGAAAVIQDLVNEGGAAINLFDGVTKENIKIGDPGVLPALEAQEKSLIKRVEEGPIGDLANTRALAETKKAILTYKLGAMVGQTGRSLAQVEAEMLRGTFDASNLPQFRAKVSSLMKGAQAQLAVEGKSLNDDLTIRDFKAHYRHMPAAIDTTTVDERIRALVKGDEDIAHAYDMIQGNRPSGKPGINEAGDRAMRNQQVHPDQTGEALTPEAPVEAPVEAAPAPTAGEPVSVQTPEEALKLPSGTVFKTPDGRTKVRP